MTTSSFWNFISAAEDEYSVYRKRIMAKFSLSAAETDIIMFLANNHGYDTAADISKVRRILKSQVSVSVKSLCEKGLLTGTYKDGNKKRSSFTDGKGKACCCIRQKGTKRFCGCSV